MSRYSVNEYTAALQALMPSGLVWPRQLNGVQTSTLRALARSYQRSDEDARVRLFHQQQRQCSLNGKRRSDYLIYAR